MKYIKREWELLKISSLHTKNIEINLSWIRLNKRCCLWGIKKNTCSTGSFFLLTVEKLRFCATNMKIEFPWVLQTPTKEQKHSVSHGELLCSPWKVLPQTSERRYCFCPGAWKLSFEDWKRTWGTALTDSVFTWVEKWPALSRETALDALCL